MPSRSFALNASTQRLTSASGAGATVGPDTLTPSVQWPAAARRAGRHRVPRRGVQRVGWQRRGEQTDSDAVARQASRATLSRQRPCLRRNRQTTARTVQMDPPGTGEDLTACRKMRHRSRQLTARDSRTPDGLPAARPTSGVAPGTLRGRLPLGLTPHGRGTRLHATGQRSSNPLRRAPRHDRPDRGLELAPAIDDRGNYQRAANPLYPMLAEVCERSEVRPQELLGDETPNRSPRTQQCSHHVTANSFRSQRRNPRCDQ